MTVKENYTIKTEYENDTHVCCICGKVFKGLGNNPYGAAWKTKSGKIIRPTFSLDEICCDECNNRYVLPGRMSMIYDKEGE